ncbi:hypothetical protein [Bifidobacterium sp. ESL0704]|uniref:hypothetical protein n=1 Tax=Bifidobacterium sp. ESL0704 TaxID=2983219 RepID=UPI0023F98796|nr:hypothetical protein [Bifidobacterium sp. ESL0704]WEV52885.1 hypothetical protein OZX64_08540 [Bifidobacterium sp. ESL0704]
MNTATIDAQRTEHPYFRKPTDRGGALGTGHPPPSARADAGRHKSTGRPGILGRKQRKPANPKLGKGRSERFEPNVPDLAARGTMERPGNIATSTAPPINRTAPPINHTTPPNRSTPMLMSNRDLPGPLSMNRLDDFGALHRLDDISAYLAEYSDTLFGRGIIMTKVVPSHAIACSRSALWVWMGGGFPDVIDIISGSHFRSMAYGRPIKTYDRCVPEGHMSTIAGLKVTSPTRTACDIALMSGATIPGKRRSELICAIMREYHISPAACLTILEKNHFWPNVPQARRFFKAVQYCF